MPIGKGTILNTGAIVVVDDEGLDGNEVQGPLKAVEEIDYKGCDIGEGCLLGNHVVIRNNVKLGNHVAMAHHSICEPYVIIGDNTTIQVYAVITSNMKVGNNCFIGPFFSTTNCFSQPAGPKGRHPDKQSGKLEYQEVGNDVSIGAGCSIAPGVKIGSNVEIGMNTFIKADVPSGDSPENPFKIRGGTVWSKKDLAYHKDKENNRALEHYKKTINPHQ
jgi:acetyltransferase-like isoleucine patch superfamily enzyme